MEPLKIEDFGKSLRPLSEVPMDEGFRFVAVLYESGKEVTVVVRKWRGKPHLMSPETGEPLLSTKSGLCWNSVKGWRNSPPGEQDTCHEFNATIA